jgi:hypothetical protein
MRRMRLALAALLALSLPVIPSHAQGPALGRPMRIVILVDSSGAVASVLNPFRAGLAAFIDAMPPEIEIGIISSGGQMRIRQAPTTDRELLKKAAGSFASDQGANQFLESLIEADQRFLRVREKRPVFMILTTDMARTVAELRFDAYNQFVDSFRSRRGMAHAIVLRNSDSGTVTQIAENLVKNTGGRIETIAAATAIPKLMLEMAQLVNAQY